MKVSLMNNIRPRILIMNNALNKIEEYVKQMSKEIGWLGTVKRNGLNFLIEDVFLFKQEVHSTTTEITPEGLSEFAMELMNTQNGMEMWNDMKLWGHSHVNMGVSPSAQDSKQMETFESSGYDFFIRMITNKKGDMKLDIYDYTTGVIYEDMPYEVKYDVATESLIAEVNKKVTELKELIERRTTMTQEEINEVKSDIQAKVTEKKWATPTYTNGIKIYGGYQGAGYPQQQTAWWDDYDYETPKKKETSATSMVAESNAEVAINSMSDEEIFEAKYCLSTGYKIEDVISFTLIGDEWDELEQLIEDYTAVNNPKYNRWLRETEGGIL